MVMLNLFGTHSTEQESWKGSIPQMTNKNGINIELTQTQYDYLYETIMFAYEMDVPEQKEWDMQTFDNMLDNVANGQLTILSNNVKGVL